MARVLGTTFVEVQLQDPVRSGLAEGETRMVSVNDATRIALESANPKEGSQYLSRARKRPNFVMPSDLVFRVCFVEGQVKTAQCIGSTQLPKFLAAVLSRAVALRVLRSPHFKLAEMVQMLGGVDAARAAAIVRDAEYSLESPADIGAVNRFTGLFGKSSSDVRFLKMPKAGGGADAPQVLVFSIIDLVKMARACDYNTAKMLVYRLLRDYFSLDVEVDMQGTGCTLHVNLTLYQCGGGQGQGSSVLYLEIQHAVEFLLVIPGSEFSAQLRRRAADTLLRVEGGDASIIDRVVAGQRFQAFLAQHDPEHPMRAVGAYAAQRNTEQAGPEAARREAVETAANRRPAWYEDLERECSTKRLRAETDAAIKIAAYNQLEAKYRSETLLEGLQAAQEQRVLQNAVAWLDSAATRPALQLCPADAVALKDMFRTASSLRAAGPDGALGGPICLTQFLQEKGQPPGKALSFGKAVKSAWAQAHPGVEPPKKLVFCHGQELPVNAYFEAHRPLLESVFASWVAREPPPVARAMQGTLPALFGGQLV